MKYKSIIALFLYTITCNLIAMQNPHQNIIDHAYNAVGFGVNKIVMPSILGGIVNYMSQEFIGNRVLNCTFCNTNSRILKLGLTIKSFLDSLSDEQYCTQTNTSGVVSRCYKKDDPNSYKILSSAQNPCYDVKKSIKSFIYKEAIDYCGHLLHKKIIIPQSYNTSLASNIIAMCKLTLCNLAISRIIFPFGIKFTQKAINTARILYCRKFKNDSKQVSN